MRTGLFRSLVILAAAIAFLRAGTSAAQTPVYHPDGQTFHCRCADGQTYTPGLGYTKRYVDSGKVLPYDGQPDDVTACRIGCAGIKLPPAPSKAKSTSTTRSGGTTSKTPDYPRGTRARCSGRGTAWNTWLGTDAFPGCVTEARR